MIARLLGGPGGMLSDKKNFEFIPSEVHFFRLIHGSQMTS